MKASAHALNWISQLRCTAADLLTKVLPLTSNGRVESPESVMGGAAMPPRAEGSATRVAVFTARAADPVPVATVVQEVLEEAAIAASLEAGAWVAAGASSTKTVLVVRVQTDEEACSLSTMAAGVVTTGAAALVTAAAA